MEVKVLRISSKSNPNSIAGAIMGVLKEARKVELNAVGAGAINQAVKGIAIARSFAAPSGKDLICIPAFTSVNVENEVSTGIKFIVREER